MSSFARVGPHGTVGTPRAPHGNARRRGRDRWQARVYVGGRSGGAVHLGMYETETAAEQVNRRVLKALLRGGPGPYTALDVWRAARRLADDGFDVGGQLGSLLPKWVCVVGGGYGYRLKGGNGCERWGYATAEEAHAAAVDAKKRARKRGGVGTLVQMSLLGLLGVKGETEVVPVQVPNPYRKFRRARRGDNPAQLTFDSLLSRDGVAQAQRSPASREKVA